MKLAPRTVLQLSGGQDSLACLFMLEPFWNGIMVAWADPGDASDDLIRLMAAVKEMVPYFARIEGDVDAPRYRRAHGDPDSTTWPRCCASAMWKPMQNWLKFTGARYVIRGSKECDPLNLIGPGHRDEDGIGYIMPLWTWNDERVRNFLKAFPLQPVYPHDCQSCPAPRFCARTKAEAA